MNNLPIQCPACKERLRVRHLACDNCQTQVEGLYEVPLFLQLEPTEQTFLLDFVKCSGSLKEMAALMKFSYPTVRNRLDEVIEKIKRLEKDACKERRKKND